MGQKIRGVVAAGHQKTAEAGAQMLHLGGNAFDASVAAILASFVTEPGLTSAAGGGFLLAHTCDNQDILFDFFTQTPSQKRNLNEVNFYPVEVDFGVTVQEFHIGLGSVAVPGNIAGVFHVHKRLGRLPFKVVAEPAIEYARNGIQLTPYQHYCITQILRPILIQEQDGCPVYLPTGEAIALGKSLLMKDFADTLSYLSEQGEREFYEGEIAKLLVKDCQNSGGYLTLDDLKNYQVIERKPLTISYRDTTFLTNPPPSSGGILTAFALKLLSRFNLAEIGFGTSRHLEALAQAMQLTNEARKESYNCSIYNQDIVDSFLNSELLSKYANQFENITNKWGSTTHISVIDTEGNAASVTTSNGEGSGYVIPGTGIMMNNMLGEEDLNPQGFHQWRENTRISSMMAPTIVLKDSQPEIVLGSGGSNRIRTAILQVISNIVDFKMSATEAVDSPRTHWENEVFHLEPGWSQEVMETLRLPNTQQVVQWQEKNMFFGGVHTVSKLSDELLEGAGDRRRDGGVAIG
jgi:gamma-glutamyltranspeptidase/glutathione hydrolase